MTFCLPVVDDNFALSWVDVIVSSPGLDYNQKYDYLNSLWFFVARHHARGWCADVLADVSRARYQMIVIRDSLLLVDGVQ
jgi:hypothetical protein